MEWKKPQHLATDSCQFFSKLKIMAGPIPVTDNGGQQRFPNFPPHYMLY